MSSIKTFPLVDLEQGVKDHGELTGLGDNDHPQYALLTGASFTGNVSTTGTLSSGGNITSGGGSGNGFYLVNGANFMGRVGDGSWGIRYGNNEYALLGNINGPVYIHYNNSAKLATQSTGARTYGTHTATDFNSTSSRRFKKAIKSLGKDVAAAFDKIRWVSYQHRDDYEGKTGKTEYGVVAEELSKVCPTAVVADESGMPYGYSHNTMFGILGKTLSDTRKENRNLRNQVYVLYGLVGLILGGVLWLS